MPKLPERSQSSTSTSATATAISTVRPAPIPNTQLWKSTLPPLPPAPRRNSVLMPVISQVCSTSDQTMETQNLHPTATTSNTEIRERISKCMTASNNVQWELTQIWNKLNEQ